MWMINVKVWIRQFMGIIKKIGPTKHFTTTVKDVYILSLFERHSQ